METVCILAEERKITIPVEFRRELGREVIISARPTCLRVYSKEEWKKSENEWEKLPNGVKKRRFLRDMCSSAMEAKVDDLGRILVPIYLQKGDKVIIAKVNNYLEIWNEENWQKRKEEKAIAIGANPTLKEIASKRGKRGEG